jgi:serine/threonine protein kinase
MTEHDPTGEPSGAVPAPSAEWPAIPGFEILEELGRGGMGVVYKARQVSSKRLVALKLLRDVALARPEDRARFRIEAEAAARMRHANIVQIYEVGEHAGRQYFAMELIEGGSLDSHLAGKPQPISAAAELTRTLALAIQHAHAQRVVHRDLKPANILIADCRLQIADLQSEPSPQSAIINLQSAIPKITDFGLAKRLDSDSTAWTKDGAVLGTASYMAPEQAAGRVQDIGPAVDVYALGAVLYELLTGRPPFQAELWNLTLQQVLYDEPTPPTRLRPDVPRDLETVCLKCLEKDPQRRYASAGELADDLGHFLQAQPVAAVPLGEMERLARVAARDGYQLVAEVGRGPRSTVYHALSAPLNHAVALKVFTAGICTHEEWQGRLGRAAEMWAALTHPQLVPVHRAGWWDGAPYVAMEYVPQGSLAAILAGRPYRVLPALRLVEQLAEIVSYLHRQGVVHGNLKPSNVLLAADGIPRVIDLHPTGGLFQAPPSAGDAPAGLAYLPPELAGRQAAEPRPFTDTYGLGVILYELLTGRPPFAGSTTADVLEQVRTQDPIPPGQLNPEVTPPLEAFCLRCLAKNPWRRHNRAFDVLVRLRYLRDELEGKDPEAERRARRQPPEREGGQGPT